MNDSHMFYNNMFYKKKSKKKTSKGDFPQEEGDKEQINIEGTQNI